MRDHIEKVLESFLRGSIYFALFLLPLKFGVPYLEQESFLFPYVVWDWLILPYWPLEFFNAFALILFSLWGIKVVLAGRLKLRWNLALTLASFFIGAALFSSFFSAYPYVSKILCQHLVSCFILFFLSSQLFTPESGGARKAVFFLVAGGLLQAAYALYQHFYGLEETLEWIRQGGEKVPANVMSRLSGKRAFGTFIYPNSLAGYFVFLFPMALALWFHQFRKNPLPGLLLFYPLVLLGGLAVTFSKGGIAALGLTILIALVAMLFLFKNRLTKKNLIIGGLAAAAAILLALGFFYLYRDFIAHRLQMGTFQERWGYWGAGLKMLLDSPLIGMGPGTFGALYPGYKTFTAEKTQLAHNDYLQLAAETGLIGILLYAALVALVLWKGFRHLKENQNNFLIAGIFWGFLAISIHHLSDFDFYVPALAGCEWIFLGILAATVFKNKTYELNLNLFALRLVFLAGLIAASATTAQLLMRQLEARYAFDLARRTAKTNHTTDALKWAALAEEREPGNALIHVFKGNLWVKSNNFEKAHLAYREASRRHPRWAVPYILEARLRTREWGAAKTGENQARVIRSWEMAINRHPSEPAYRLELAQFLENLGMKEEALIQYNAILKWDPAHPKAQERARELGRGLAEKLNDRV